MVNTVVLIIMDGFGLAPPGPGNAIYLANPQNFNSFIHNFPNTILKASGEAVGLPRGEVGNTEVGHLNIGAGKIVFQDLPRINMAIADGSFYKNDILLGAVNHLKKTNGKLHLLGLISEGSVHSHLEHLLALLYFAKENNLKEVYIHAITDGRDSFPKSALNLIKELQNRLATLGVGKFASVMGRYYAMDRDRRWERTEKAYRCITSGSNLKADDILHAIEDSYKKGVTDEFIEPTNILVNDRIVLVEDGDAVIFFNYRIDRPRQLTKAFVLENFEQEANKTLSFDPYEVKYYRSHQVQPPAFNPPFKRERKINNLYFVTMTEYEKNLPAKVAFPPIIVPVPLGKVLAENNVMQLRMAESEKERFVTYYFNGLREQPFYFEDRLIIPSPKVPTYDLKPEMAAYELTDLLIKKIRENKYRFIVLNFANPDMVGHTGSIQATIAAIKAVDDCLSRIVHEIYDYNLALLVTADHGNAEQKINPKTGEISTEHTDNPVPFLFIHRDFEGRFQKLEPGILADIAPTVLFLLGIEKPGEMTGRNLLEELFPHD
jgi:2,3-bisphosphoglycerate-independent phosphoglycerate mutase